MIYVSPIFKCSTATLVVTLFVAALTLPGCYKTPSSPPTLRLATTTSTHDSGLLDLLLPTFEQQYNLRIDVIAAGTGKALKLGETGDVDVVLVHARQAEDAFMAAGHGIRREDVMANRFELLGPPDDPAKITGLSAAEALQRIAAGSFRFVSRGDYSGTHKRELALWSQGGGKPNWDQYVETGQGMGASLIMANQMLAYILADRGTYLRFSTKIDLTPFAAQSSGLHNPYGIMVVSSEQPSEQVVLAHALVDYLISPSVQTKIQDFKVAGESLFSPLQPTSLK